MKLRIYEINDNTGALKLSNLKMVANKNQFNFKDISFNSSKITMTPNDKLYLLQLETCNNISGASKLIALKFKTQTNIKNIKLVNFVYSKNKLPSEFSNKLSEELQQQLVTSANYQVQRNNTRGLFSKTDKTLHILSGTYTIENDKLKISAVLTNSETNNIVSAASSYLPLSYLTNNNIKYEPENEEEIEKRKNVINNDEIKNEFDVNIWTNKGNDNVVFKKDEVLQMTLQTDQRCFVRLIYILADGTTVLLLDNFEITSYNVGKAYKIPQEFYCAEPFGAETLIMSAQTTKKFKPLTTENIDGYDFIKDDLTSILKNTRGFKKKVKRAEKVINFVTTE